MGDIGDQILARPFGPRKGGDILPYEKNRPIPARRVEDDLDVLGAAREGDPLRSRAAPGDFHSGNEFSLAGKLDEGPPGPFFRAALHAENREKGRCHQTDGVGRIQDEDPFLEMVQDRGEKAFFSAKVPNRLDDAPMFDMGGHASSRGGMKADFFIGGDGIQEISDFFLAPTPFPVETYETSDASGSDAPCESGRGPKPRIHFRILP